MIAWRPRRGVEDYVNRPDLPDNVTSFGFCNLESGKFVEVPGYQETFSLLDGVPTIKFLTDNPHVFVYGLHDEINETYRIEYRGAVRKVTLRPGFLEESSLLMPVSAESSQTEGRTPSIPGLLVRRLQSERSGDGRNAVKSKGMKKQMPSSQ